MVEIVVLQLLDCIASACEGCLFFLWFWLSARTSFFIDQPVGFSFVNAVAEAHWRLGSAMLPVHRRHPYNGWIVFRSCRLEESVHGGGLRVRTGAAHLGNKKADRWSSLADGSRRRQISSNRCAWLEVATAEGPWQAPSNEGCFPQKCIRFICQAAFGNHYHRVAWHSTAPVSHHPPLGTKPPFHHIATTIPRFRHQASRYKAAHSAVLRRCWNFLPW